MSLSYTLHIFLPDTYYSTLTCSPDDETALNSEPAPGSVGCGGHVGRRGRGARRLVSRQAKATLLCDKSKSSNVGDRGRSSPTRQKEEHSGASEDSGRYLCDTHTHTYIHPHIYPVAGYSGTSHFVLSLVYTLHIFLPDTYYSTLDLQMMRLL